MKLGNYKDQDLK